MAQFPSSNGTEPKEIVECSVCNGDVGLPNIVVIDNSPVCHVCVKQIFINATEDESNYPPRWADQELKITQYKHILDEDLVKQYRRKTHEYRKKWDDRVYCPTEQEGKVCGEYLGGRRNKDKHTRLASTCKKCSKRTCLACETQPTSRSGHVCDPSTEEKEQEAASFAGLSKGKDWQKCPNCKRNIELEDGCNHVVCRCGTSLCFVCGQPAKGNSNHWSKVPGTGSTCPRYNHPNDYNAMWEGEAGAAGRAFDWVDNAFEAAPPNPGLVPQVDELLADLRARRNAIVDGMIAGERAQVAQELQNNVRWHRQGLGAHVPSLGPNPSPSPPQTAAAGTVARHRRLGGRLGEQGVGSAEDHRDLEGPATAQRRPAVFQGLSRFPRGGWAASRHAVGVNSDNAGASPPHRGTPRVPGTSWPHPLRRPADRFEDVRAPEMTEEDIQDQNPIVDFAYPDVAHGVNAVDHTTSSDPHSTVHRQAQVSYAQRPASRRGDALADLLSSLSPGEERLGRPRTITRPQRTMIPDPAAVQSGRPAATLQPPRIPERGSSLKIRVGTFDGIRRQAQPADRDSSLDFDFQFPADQSASSDAEGDVLMRDGEVR